MSTTGPIDRLQEIVSLAAELSGVAQAQLIWRRPRGEDVEVAVPAPRRPTASTVSLRLSERLRMRALASSAPLVVAEEGGSKQSMVVMRLLDHAGAPAGILAFELNSAIGTDAASTAPRSEVDHTWLRRFSAAAAMAELAFAALTHAEELERANASLRARADIDRALTRAVQGGGGLSAIVRECATLTGKPVALFDREGRQLTTAYAAGVPNVRMPAVHEILARCEPAPTGKTEAMMAPAGRGGLSRRKIVAPISAGDESFGWLVIDEHPSGFRPLDRFAAERSAVHLGSEFVVQRRVARVAWNAKTSLARQMVRGTQGTKDLMASAEYLGVDVEAPRVLAYVLEPSHARSDESLDQALAAAVERALGVEVLATRGSEGMLLLVEAPHERGAMAMVNAVKEALEEVTGKLCSPDAIVGVSSVCEPGALSRGYREAREVAQCIDRFAGRSAQRVLAVDDLGPARLFLANSDTSGIRGYVGDVLGPLLTGDPAMTDLLTTLQCYFEESRSVRNSAARLGLHENTIRLRLARVHAATALDVAGDANDQLSVQTALLVLRLQGHPSLTPFGRPARSADAKPLRGAEMCSAADQTVRDLPVPRKSA